VPAVPAWLCIAVHRGQRAGCASLALHCFVLMRGDLSSAVSFSLVCCRHTGHNLFAHNLLRI